MISNEPSEPRVYVVDDDASVRQSMEWLGESAGLKVETFASGAEFLAQLDPSLPGCLVVDVRMPGMSGLELQEKLTERGIEMPIIIMTAFGDASTAVRAMKHGAFDFIEKPIQHNQMVDLLNACLDADAERRREAAKKAAIEERLATLTKREREVLELIVAGRSNKETAAQLGIRFKTVEVHRANIMRKTQAGSFAELVRMASG